LRYQQSEILIAELAAIKFDAFEENENSLSAFIKQENFNEEEFKSVVDFKNISYTKQLIADTNWNAKWESEFEPVVVDNLVAIRAAFHRPAINVEHEIIITPKMSFGTGHHATTYLMLQQMGKIDFTGKSVLDFGTGTGILAIMAAKLGAQKVVAVDNDEWSIRNAKENFAANDCTAIELLQKEDLSGLGIFDVILANINLNVIVNAIGRLKAISHAGSMLLISGFLSSDEVALNKIFMDAGYQHAGTVRKNEWISMLLRKS
jgi:ribosomal protein L11 methyltransferase